MVTPKQFNVICADPPWPVPPPGSKGRNETEWFWKGDVMSIGALALMDIPKADNSVLVLWCPGSALESGLLVMAAWRFKYKGHLIWAKTRNDMVPRQRGVGWWTSNVHEIALIGFHGKSPTETRAVDKCVLPSVVYSPARLNGGGKPDEVYEILKEQFKAPRLEMFARERRDGWYCHGHEVPGGADVEIKMGV